MGSRAFKKMALGENASKVYDELVRDAIEEYGEDRYNGTISTTSFYGISKKYDKPTEANKKKAYAFIEKEIDEVVDKRDCYCVDLGIDHYEVVTIKKEINKPKITPMFKKMFVVHYWKYDMEKEKSFSSKREAESFAFEKKMGNPDYPVSITQDYVLVKGDNTVSVINVEITHKKTMTKQLKPMPNRTVKAIHKYIFYGWAAE